MRRSFTVSAFLMMMTLLIVLKSPVLGYCHCIEGYFFGDCECIEQPVCSSGCCSDTPNQTAPCDDCSDELAVDVGDYLWSPATEIPALDLLAATDFSAPGLHARPDVLITRDSTVRAHAPPHLACEGVPVFLRHAVMRI